MPTWRTFRAPDVPPDPEALGAVPGDVLTVRSPTLYGRLIRWKFRRYACWTNHDGILTVDAAGNWYVAEALLSAGVTATPWDQYRLACLDGGYSFCVLRPEDPGYVCWRAAMVAHRKTQEGIKYDWKAVLGFALDLPLGSETEWYCTEFARACVYAGGADPWHKTRPTPLTTQKRVLQKRLNIVAEVLAHGAPAFPTAWKGGT